jgi:hypothetical protein
MDAMRWKGHHRRHDAADRAVRRVPDRPAMNGTSRSIRTELDTRHQYHGVTGYPTHAVCSVIPAKHLTDMSLLPVWTLLDRAHGIAFILRPV